MKLAIENHKDVVVVQPEESRLDALIAQDFKERLSTLIRDGHKKILLDLASVEFIDSSGLGAMVTVLKKIGHLGEMRLCSISTPVQSLLETTRMNKVFKIFADRQQALSHF